MKYLLLILTLFCNPVIAKTVMIAPPDGLTFLWSFKPETKLEEKAFVAITSYLNNDKDSVYSYYLVSHGLDVSTGVYAFEVKHRSSYRKSKTVIDQSYKNGILSYDVNKKVVNFRRK